MDMRINHTCFKPDFTVSFSKELPGEEMWPQFLSCYSVLIQLIKVRAVMNKRAFYFAQLTDIHIGQGLNPTEAAANLAWALAELDNPDTFVETNLSQMIAYSIYRGVSEKWLDGSCLESADRMRKAAHRKVDEFGFVQGVLVPQPLATQARLQKDRRFSC